MNEAALNQFSRIAADTAMRAAVQFINTNGIKVEGAEIDRLLGIIRAHVGAKVGPALDDAREALAARMDKAAEATFLASMRLAGINAAHEFAEGI